MTAAKIVKFKIPFSKNALKTICFIATILLNYTKYTHKNRGKYTHATLSAIPNIYNYIENTFVIRL